MQDVAFDRLYSILNGILQAVHGQLQFAEAKNGALLAANLAAVVGIGAVTTQASSIPDSVAWALSIGSFGLAGAGLIALTSFLPVLGADRSSYAKGAGVDGVSLIFWEEIAKYTPASYGAAVMSSLGVEGAPQKLHLDIAQEIVVNSAIAGRKFARFGLAAWTTFAAVVVPTVVLAGLWIGAGFRFP